MEPTHIGGILDRPLGHLFQVLPQRVFQCVCVQVHRQRPDLLEKILDMLGLDLFLLESSSQILVERELGRHEQAPGQGQVRIPKKAEHERMMLVKLMIEGVRLLKCGLEYPVEDLPLFVPEERPEGIRRCTEMLIHDPKRLRKVASLKGLGGLLHEVSICFLALVLADTTVDIVISHMEHTKAEQVGLLGDLGGDPGPTHREFGPPNLKALVIISFHGKA